MRVFEVMFGKNDGRLCGVWRWFEQLRSSCSTLRQVLTKFSEFFIFGLSLVFHRKISRQERLRATIPDPIDLQHPPFCLSSSAFRFSKVDRRWQLIAS